MDIDDPIEDEFTKLQILITNLPDTIQPLAKKWYDKIERCSHDDEDHENLEYLIFLFHKVLTQKDLVSPFDEEPDESDRLTANYKDEFPPEITNEDMDKLPLEKPEENNHIMKLWEDMDINEGMNKVYQLIPLVNPRYHSQASKWYVHLKNNTRPEERDKQTYIIYIMTLMLESGVLVEPLLEELGKNQFIPLPDFESNYPIGRITEMIKKEVNRQDDQASYDDNLTKLRRTILSLPEKYRPLGAKWYKKLKPCTRIEDVWTSEHLFKLFIACLNENVLVGPFKIDPGDNDNLENLSVPDYTLKDIADMIDREKNNNQSEQGHHRRPINSRVSKDLNQYVAHQKLPNSSGVQCYFAYSTDNNQLPDWINGSRAMEAVRSGGIEVITVEEEVREYRDGRTVKTKKTSRDPTN